jgi:acyl dehydratase
MTELRFDDIAALEAVVTDEFGAWGPELMVTMDMIRTFADLSGDHQWIHVDVDRAKQESPFGDVIAHGFLTLMLFPRLEVPRVRITGYGSAVNYGIDRLRFLAPVLVGARMRGRSRLAAVAARAYGTLVTTEFEARAGEAEKPAILYTGQALYLP